MEEVEEILKPNPDRFSLLPIQHWEVWDMYKKAEACIWHAVEVDLGDDLIHWKTQLNEGEKIFITYVLAFFANADGIVNENLATRFMKEVQWPEARCFYGFQIAMENIHQETYSIMIDTLIKESEKKEVFQAIQHYASIEKKANWALKWIESQECFAHRLAAFAIVEGIWFSGAFCAIFWLKKRNLMPGLCFSNELISRDEGLHCDFAVLLFKMCTYKDPQVVMEMIIEAVQYEHEFIEEALPVSLIGMNEGLMKKYIQFVADRLAYALIGKKIFHTENPFDWMVSISLQGKTNFFERRVSEYQKAGVLGDKDDNVFTLDADF